jgi:hypothetical protein
MPTPPDFVPNTALTAAQLDKGGLWRITTFTVPAGQTSVSISNVFSADFDDYLVTYHGGTSSTKNDLGIRLGSTNTGYYYASVYKDYGGGGVASVTVNNGAQWTYAGCQDNPNALDVRIYSPYKSEKSMINALYIGPASDRVVAAAGGFLENTTSYTGFTILAGAGTFGGGTVQVYGYNNLA